MGMGFTDADDEEDEDCWGSGRTVGGACGNEEEEDDDDGCGCGCGCGSDISWVCGTTISPTREEEEEEEEEEDLL